VAGRRSDSNGPAQMMSDPHAHALDYLGPSIPASNCRDKVSRRHLSGPSAPVTGCGKVFERLRLRRGRSLRAVAA
jgi:hypothetical protein